MAQFFFVMNTIFACSAVANDAAQMSMSRLAFAEELGVTRVYFT